MEGVHGEALPAEEEPEEAMPDASVGATPMEEDSMNESLVENAQNERPQPEDNIVERQIGGKVFKIGRLLSPGEQEEVAAVISRHLDAFAWTTADMLGIDPDFLCHHLTMDAKVRPVRQRRRKFNEKRCLVVKEETRKLLSVGHIREIQYPEWLANVVIVKKANGKWRMCVDFTDLNKACPKDSYPLPNIDALVDSASGCKMLSFLDAFSGFMLTERGIEANPDKCAAIIAVRSPTLVKEVQQLTGRMAALSRFVSAGGEKGHPYFQCLKRNSRFAWIDECETAFLKLKERRPSRGGVWVTVDGSSNQQGSGVGIILEGPNGVLIEQALRFAFKASNNQAEYEALIARMLLAKEMGAQSLLAKSDSQLVTGQVTGEYQAKDPQMAAYLRYAEVLKRAFTTFELVHVPREQNARADLLAKLASSGKGGRQRTVIRDTLKTPRKFVADNRVDVLHVSTTRGKPRSHRSLSQDTMRAPCISTYATSPEEEKGVQVCALEEGDTWMTPYRRYLADEILPAEPEEGKKIKRNAARYTLVDGILFRHRFTHPILTCVSGDECTRIMAELHEGICGSHVGGRSLASMVIRAGFFGQQ
ncbi:uncharacterized protein [Phaseolus vulgaris]|uniref:uncharacterized protein n=1 Tax=Phaseolus vulgaris TaxID=3885 RepID=UPI0035C94ADC